MSMPVLTYGCTGCDLHAWDAQTWGYRFYLIEGKELKMRVAMGWCDSCHDLSGIEVKPDEAIEAEIAKEVKHLHGVVENELLNNPPIRRWWQIRAVETPALICAKSELVAAQERLRLVQQLCSLMVNRKSGGRCLTCGSEQSTILPILPISASFDRIYPDPKPIGFTHPGCGGELTVCSDGLRLNIQPVRRAYDTEGRLLEADS
ncbi:MULTISPECIES: hypothetical protein [Pseudomonas]|uniref:hypothetical protein n=1 Tax=Pseudomonas TaxID=286 RepID=UPI001AE7EEF0|nr:MULTISPECIES: hypothetical protein [Pseudomonas]MBP2085813.1 hypothetical protein [Pseudomonas sp. PvP089]MBP2088485.1 hypothetical protein [Pseudomonas sp. PvP088]MBP2225195.1 hypothetical protein [Pseudomonas putida]